MQGESPEPSIPTISTPSPVNGALQRKLEHLEARLKSQKEQLITLSEQNEMLLQSFISRQPHRWPGEYVDGTSSSQFSPLEEQHVPKVRLLKLSVDNLLKVDIASR